MDEARNYLILGASGGIGSALSRRLHAAGHRLSVVGRNREALESVTEGRDALIHEIDATRFDEVADVVKATIEWSGTLHGVVNCVGSILLKPAHLTSESEYLDVIAANLTSSFGVIRAAATAMRESGGSIVLFSSAAAGIGLGNHEAIAAAKGGVCGLVRSAAATYAAQNIRVNAIAPGLVATPMTKRITNNETALAASTAMHPLGRVGQPEDIAPAVEWLLSDDSSWVTGQVIGIDGGLASLKTRAARV